MRAFAFALVSLALVWTVAASPVSNEVEDELLVVDYKDGNECPAKHFIDICNYCTCMDDGFHAACTKMACQGMRRERRDADEEEKPVEIPVVHGWKDGQDCPADYFKNDCNWCSCGKNKKSAVCTRVSCPTTEEATTEKN